MSLRTFAARSLCAVTPLVLAAPPEAWAVRENAPGRRQVDSQTPILRQRAPSARTGLVLERLSERDLRQWREIEEVVAATVPGGAPRSETLRRLWEWARTTPHVIHVEIVEPSEVPNGIAGEFVVERVDPAKLSHTGLVRLCPGNIRNGRVATGPNMNVDFRRFDGLTDAADRYAEVLAHELAHAAYVLESPERVARIEEAQRARQEFLDGRVYSLDRIPSQLRRRLEASRAALEDVERQAEAVEARVLAELGRAPSSTARR